MALGLLFYAFVIMTALAIVGIILLIFIKTQRVNDIVLIIMATYAVLIACISASAQASNLIWAQMFALAIGLIGVVGIVVRYASKNVLVAKILVCISVTFSIYNLYFM